MGKVAATEITATWYHPRNGGSKDAGSFDNKGQQVFTAPTAGYGRDWVLILDDENKHYSKP